MMTPRQLHRYLGLFAAIFVLVLSVTGILLNHPSLYSDKLAVGAPVVSLTDASGTWVGTDSGLYFSARNTKAPKAVRLPVPATDVSLLFENASGLFVVLDDQVLCFKGSNDVFWQRVSVPPSITHITHLSGDLQLTTDQGVFRSSDSGYTTWQHDVHWGGGSSIKKQLLLLHTGLWATPWMVYLHDLSAVILIGLIVSGFWIVFRKR